MTADLEWSERARNRVSFTVRGLPAAQGSARAFVRNGHAHIATHANETNTPLGAWRAAIRTEGQKAMGTAAPLDGPLSVDVVFTMPRPKSHYRANGQLKPTAPVYHTGKPDLDKLLRALFDGLTNVVVREDCLIAMLRRAAKVYGNTPGCAVTVWAAES
jgi:crossover junction endodeoxyribonuclease RusA